MYFGFSFCPDICPNELIKQADVIEMLAAQIGDRVRSLSSCGAFRPKQSTCAQVFVIRIFNILKCEK